MSFVVFFSPRLRASVVNNRFPFTLLLPNEAHHRQISHLRRRRKILSAGRPARVRLSGPVKCRQIQPDQFPAGAEAGARQFHSRTTRTINFIGIYAKAEQPHPEMLLVDLPGYGYAKLSKQISAEWPKFIEPYLQERETLALCVVLIDSNIPAQAPDRHLIDFLRSMGRDLLVV